MQAPRSPLTIAALSLIIAAILFLCGAVVLKGGPQSLQTPSIAGLVSFVVTLLGILVTILKVDSVQQKVNGHLQAHVDEARRGGVEEGIAQASKTIESGGPRA